MIDIATLRAMAAAGASVEVILAAVEAMIAEGGAYREKNAERQKRWRDRHRGESNVTITSHNDTVTLRNVTNDTLSSNLSSFGEPLKEGSKEVRTVVVEGQKRGKHALPADWTPKASHYDKRDRAFVDSKAEDLRDWALGKGIMRADWDRTFNQFLKPKEGQSNGFRGTRQLQDDTLSCSKAADRLIEATKRGEFKIAPRPSLLPSESQSDLRLLPKG